MPVVLSEADFTDRSSINGRELHQITETARMLGCRVVPLPPDITDAASAERAFAYVPELEPQAGIWAGFIPEPARYRAVFEAALARGIRLANTPEQHLTAMEFDRFYPLLGELTPASRTLTAPKQAAEAAEALGLPLFVKGAVKSSKEQGWGSCVATSEPELRELVARTLASPHRSRGRAIVRQLAPLRTVGHDPQGFPLGREYRVFLYERRVLAHGFYWDEQIDAARLSAAEERALLALAERAAARVGAPLIAVDIAQLERGDWIVIEVGDGQFSGLSHVEPLRLWSNLLDALR